MPSVMSFPTRIVHGRGAIRELPAELRRAGARKLLLVTDKGILQAGLLRFVTPLLEQAGVPFIVFSEFDPNPTDKDALKGIEAYRAAGADAIVSVGGGASLDMSKAIRLLVHHDPPLDRRDGNGRAHAQPGGVRGEGRSPARRRHRAGRVAPHRAAPRARGEERQGR